MLGRNSRATGLVFLTAYLLLNAAALYAMVRFGGFDAGDALGVSAVFGVGFSFAAWLSTIRVKPLPYQVRGPWRESATLLVYLLPLTSIVAWGFGAIHRNLQASRPIRWRSPLSVPGMQLTMV